MDYETSSLKIAQDTKVYINRSQLIKDYQELVILYNQIAEKTNDQKSLLFNLKQLHKNNNRDIYSLSARDLGKELLQARRQTIQDNEINQYQKLFNELESAYRKAYSYIHKIRNYFYEDITYTFGFELDGSVYEATMTMEQLLSNAYIQMTGRGNEFEKLFGLRLKANKDLLQSIVNSRHHVEQLHKLSKSEEKLYKETMDQETTKFTNKGQRFEAFKNQQLNKEKTIEQALKEARSNNLSGFRGGDIGDEQIKFMDASVVTGAALLRTMEYLIKNINPNNIQEQELKRVLAIAFGPNSKFESLVKGNGSKAAKIALEEYLKTIPDITFTT